ncbi:MAG: hypothetical protein V4819_21135 [Verrucomicrobiota bacterium]
MKIELIPDTGVASLQQLPDLGTRVEEIYANVTCVAGLPNSLDTVLRNTSKLMRVEGSLPGARPDIGGVDVSVEANDGATLTSGNFTGSAAARTGVHALLKADLFNMLCIPPYQASGDVDNTVLTEAATLCRDRRAFLILDAPSAWDEISDAVSGVKRNGPAGWLDGDAWQASRAQHPIALQSLIDPDLASGDRRRGGDFEMWFSLIPGRD